jgi:hypothetical protein
VEVTAPRYLVRTSRGYVGRWNLDSDLVDSCPKGFAYSWDRAEAEQLAERFGGEVVAR